MSGHSHWATTHRQKEVNDAKRAAIFTKIGRIVTIAARGGGDPAMNFKLRLAMDQARAVNMPKDRIERAIKTGTGELKEGAQVEEVLYEAYLPVRSTAEAGGPGQVALLIEGVTDNKNRTVGEVKSLLIKNNGKFVPSGSVSFMFKRAGLITFDLEKYSRETLENETLESGADDFTADEAIFTAVTAPDALQSVQKYFEGKGFTPEDAILGYVPTQTVTLSEKDRASFEKLRDVLNDHADVQTVWDNAAYSSLLSAS